MTHTPATDLPVSRKNLRLAVFWAMLGSLGTLAVFPYLLAITPVLAAQVSVPLWVVAIAQAVQMGIILLPLCWVGLRLGQSMGFDSPLARALVYRQPLRVVRSASIAALVTGGAGGLMVVVLAYGFDRWMPEPVQSIERRIALWRGLLACLYGGITEELLMRLGLMTLLTWSLWKLVQRGRSQPSDGLIKGAIGLTAILFGVGHLSVAATLWPLTPWVILRTIALNLPLGIAFGLFYWRWGLEYAMLAHFCADVVLRGLSGH